MRFLDVQVATVLDGVGKVYDRDNGQAIWVYEAGFLVGSLRRLGRVG